MPQIKFKGKTYYSEFEMPPKVRQAYQKEKLKEARSKPLTDVVDLHPDVKAVYEKAVNKLENSPSSTQQTDHLPTTDEIYRQSAPRDMRDLPSDESIYRPAPPVVDPDRSTIEPESGIVASRLIYGVLIAIVVTALVYFAVQLIR
jgi:hypothetical protein